MGYNILAGKIPKSLFDLPALQVLFLNSNQLSGSLEDISNPLSSPLYMIELNSNQLTGKIPKSFYQLKHLEQLFLYSNALSGTLALSSFGRLENLTMLDLSDNMLSVIVDEGDNNTSLPYFPKIQSLYLGSCNLSKIPGALRYLDKLSDLDLSNNQIKGVIPSWIWDNWKDHLQSLDLSHNMFTNLERVPSLFHVPELTFLDLSFNRLQGSIPIHVSLNPIATLDYSNNNFSSILPDFGKIVKNATYINLSRNKLNGLVPSSICSVSELTILDLSYNNFTGMFPSCLIENEKLTVLKIKENKLQGIIPINIKVGCNFQTIDLNGNQFEGKLPRSLLNCKHLELVDVGNNHIVGSFPSWLGILSHLRVLVLRSNQFNGTIRDKIGDNHINGSFSSLQVLDLASNNFSGNLPKGWFNKLKLMITNVNDAGQIPEDSADLVIGYYHDTVTVTFKGGELTFTKALATFNMIDFSMNSFDGPIPESIGKLVLLHGLNMSYNNFTGQIPYQFRKLTHLESLDLSWNQLSGEIPQELTSLTSLEWLNVSYNNLSGRIPQGNQFLTFSDSSFEGNMGLCGLPLSKQCDTRASLAPNTVSPPESNSFWQDKLEVILLFSFVGLGFGVGFSLSFLVRLFCPVEGWVCKH